VKAMKTDSTRVEMPRSQNWNILWGMGVPNKNIK
jgi:hypothetical protein